uniref:Uncharacterized protein n=1 Tax=viral metagenome TaxID=1070528 RepID=A0A6M3ITQ5_9ZZZZ
MDNDERIFQRWLVPLPGLIVRDPVTKTPLAEEGEWKPWTGAEGRLWRKRARRGSVTIGQPPTAAMPKKSKAGKED